MTLVPSLERLKAILALGLPITGGMLSQSVLNLIDSAMVGSLGKDALAGIGVGGYANFMAIALVMGLSTAVQTLVARRQGQQRTTELASLVNGGLLIALTLCLPLTLVFVTYSHSLLAWITDRTEVLATAVPYFEYRVFAIAAVGFNLCFRGYWNGVNEAWTFLRILILLHISNVIISYCLIFGVFGWAGMGAPGAGLGTAIALWIGAGAYAYLTYKGAGDHGLFRKMPKLSELKNLLQLSIPSSLQQLMFATSITVLFAIIAQIGTNELAISQVLINLALLLILPAVGLGMAATTLVSQALGNQDGNQAASIGWDVVKVATIILMILSTPLWLIPDTILGLFIHDPNIVDQARIPLRITGFAICIDSAAIVFTQALLGAGANRTVMLISTTGQWLFYLPLAWLIGPYLGGGLLGIWLVQLFHRGLSSVFFAYIWSQKRWIHIRL